MLSGAVLEIHSGVETGRLVGIADVLVESESVMLAGAVVEVHSGVFGEILVEVVTHSEVWAVMLVAFGCELNDILSVWV